MASPNAALKTAVVLAGMLAGADSIKDLACCATTPPQERPVPSSSTSLGKTTCCRPQQTAWSHTPVGSTGVTAIGVDEHVWRRTRRDDKYVAVIIDLTGIGEGTGPARLLDMVEGRSKQAFKT